LPDKHIHETWFFEKWFSSQYSVTVLTGSSGLQVLLAVVAYQQYLLEKNAHEKIKNKKDVV